MDDKPTTTINTSLQTWQQIDILAAQIMSPTTGFQFDSLKLAHAVIEDQIARAAQIRRMIPEPARNSF